MTTPANHSPAKPKLRKDRGMSPVWIIPALTLILAGWFVTKAIQEAGQQVQIYFEDAQGLIAGRTAIRYQGLEIGMVRDINLADDLSQIYVDADIYPEATKLLGEDTQFWLVKPSASISGVTGLDALVSGNYISILPSSEPEKLKEYVYNALSERPSDALLKQGLPIELVSRDLGSINIGSKILYKKIPIGEVYNYELDRQSKDIHIDAVIYPRYQNLINQNSRFWNVSGIRTSFGLDGVDIKMESLSALISGAIAVDLPEEGDDIEAKHSFRLFADVETAGRGISITIALPESHGIANNGASLLFKGLEIGVINNVYLSEDREQIFAKATVEPMFADLLNTGSSWVIEEAKLSVTKLENLSNLIKGNHLSLIAGEGEKARRFVAIRQNELSVQTNNAQLITLIADQSFGLSSGSPLVYKGIQVGEVSTVSLTGNEVAIEVLVEKEFSSLIKNGNRFYLSSQISAQFADGALNVDIPPIPQLLAGSISFTSQGTSSDKNQFTLYQNQQLAELANYGAIGQQKVQLLSSTLPSVSVGSPLLYRNLPVGQVKSYQLTDQGMVVDLLVDKNYQHLIKDSTVFWNHSGVTVDASLAGVSIDAQPLSKLLQGAIAFDNGPQISNKTGRYYTLFDSYKTAVSYGTTVELTSGVANNINVGTAIHYQSVQVGEVTQMHPNFNTGLIAYTARLYPEYARALATKGTRYSVRQPQISFEGVKNLSAAIVPVIDVIPAKSSAKQLKFDLDYTSKEQQTTQYVLQTPHRSSVNIGTPVHFRNLTVGQVVDVELGSLSDRILITVEVSNEFTYLIRSNTYFWNESGLDVSIGLSGANIKAGTIDSIINGGIAFATPDEALRPVAKENSSFILHPQADPKWLAWRTAIPKP
jgi:paraquat-inducible protein B